MSNELERLDEQRIERERHLLLVSVYGGLVEAVSRSGGEMLGLSIRYSDSDVLMTLRAEFPAGMMIAFVGGYDIAGCFIKATREGRRDALNWKKDKWRENGG